MVGNFGKPSSTQIYDRYAFYAGLHNRVVVARKHKTKNIFLISGTVQPYSNKIGNAPLETNAIITLGGQTAPVTSSVPNEPLKFKIRRQGSMYVYDKTQNPPVFYQLDGWHESTHPDWWSRNFSIEAELFEKMSTPPVIKTEVPLGTVAGDYTQFTSYIIPTTTAVVYRFTPRESTQTTGHLWIRARGTGDITVKVNAVVNAYRINDTSWKWYKIPTNYTFSSGVANNIEIAASGNTTNLDMLFVSSESNPTLSPSAPMGVFGEAEDGEIIVSPITNPEITPPPLTTPPISTPPAENDELTQFERNLRIGIISEDVKALQTYLNEKGFIVSTSGEGSPGNEIPNFGPKTRAAVIKLQETYKEKILTPVNLNKGTGFFGPFSRGFVNEDIKQ